ncbi:MAG TPA: lipase maturation factor family protein [Gemmatimonadales bacterium]|nr:lipase maturation factor family protein [Gemmatimonadales bacterium]
MDITEDWAIWADRPGPGPSPAPAVPSPTASPTPPTYLLSRWLFLRLVGVTYMVAFASLGAQVPGLVGEHGILPAGAFLERAHALYGSSAYRLFPTLYWLGAGDGALRALCWTGVGLAALVVGGVAQAPLLLLLWAAYLSLSVAGQTFLWFQWDALLLETGLLAALYAPIQLVPSRAERSPPRAVRWLLWGLLFRLMMLSGVTKLASGDPTWRRLTALDYHFWTQPLPTPVAWYAHWLPEWTHQGMTLTILVIESVVPFLIFLPARWRRARHAACAALLVGQVGIALTGNYGFFNLLAIALCVPLLDDAALARVLPLGLRDSGPEPRWHGYVLRGVAPLLALLALGSFVGEIAGTRGGSREAFAGPLLRVAEPFRSVNGYGLFRVMTTERPEIVIEGSRDSVHWSEYGFPWKPGDVRRRPAFVAPHMPRLDWQMWFAALDPERAREWLGPLVRHLLLGTPSVVRLLGTNPFPDAPPRYLRLAYYRYRFTTPAERRTSGAWWAREFVAYLTPALSLARTGRDPHQELAGTHP